MDDEGFRVADVREEAEQLHVVDKPLACLQSAVDAEAENRTEAARVVPLRQVVRRVVWQAGITHPAHVWVVHQEVCYLQRVLAVALHAQVERLQSLEEQERVERREGGAEVAEQLNACLDDVRHRPKRLRVLQPVVRGVGLREGGEVAVRPVEPAAVHNHAADACAVTADELRCAMHHDVRSVLQGTHQVRARQRVINDKRDARLVSDVRHRLNVEGVQPRVSDRLGVDRAGLLS